VQFAFPAPLGAESLPVGPAAADECMAAGEDVAGAGVAKLVVFVATGLEEVTLGAKIPPGLLGSEGAGVEPVVDAGGMTTMDDRPELVGAGVAVFPHTSGSAAKAVDATVSTESPGSGNTMSLLSGVLHCVLGRLAMNMSGSLLKAVLSLAPPVIVMGAQFIYISRLPILLNHVHASVDSPLGTSLGMLKLKVAGSVPVVGHPPTIEWMTLKLDCAFGCLSRLMLIWQDPPACGALPMKLRDCCWSTAMLFICVTS